MYFLLGVDIYLYLKNIASEEKMIANAIQNIAVVVMRSRDV